MSDTEHTVRRLLEDLGSAYEARDAERALSLFTDDIIFVGTGSDEIRLGHHQLKAQVERDLAEADQLRATVSDVTAIAGRHGDCAWFCAHLALDVVADGEPFRMPMRVTGVAADDGDRWLFRQTHFSLPFGEQAEGRSFPATT